MESQITRIVEKIIAEKAELLDEKFKYWHEEVNMSISTRFNDMNQQLLDQILQLQNELATQHSNHI